MVKILSVFMATLAAISPVAQAGGCTPGLNYCGSTLIKYGVKKPTEVVPDFSYHCQPDGTVKFNHKCDYCVEKGAGQNDLCVFWG
ncbi:hypothetical protein E4U30_006827 [Claviceps sp. LM220 group G6]|nr:hypothetical protein E4U15_001610 [Claviceps sp. LM218 group G6]KAG6091499.1 hypothetical protein E4U30_006827 [Claviceps sp. LM220 group G6]KAG6103196.1 hypothetical protein E4U31_003028 [Claviceps sp. LM219 group G6]